MDKEIVIQFCEKSIRQTVTFLYKWLSEDAEVLGYIVAVIHVLVATTLGVSVLLAHTIYPVWQFQLGTFMCMFIVWVQHIVLKVCVFTIAETNLSSFAPSNIYLAHFFSSIFGSNIHDALTTLVLVETVMVGCFSLELIALFSIFIQKIQQ